MKRQTKRKRKRKKEMKKKEKKTHLGRTRERRWCGGRTDQSAAKIGGRFGPIVSYHCSRAGPHVSGAASTTSAPEHCCLRLLAKTYCSMYMLSM